MEVEDLSVSGLAEQVRVRRAAEEAARREVLWLAVAWADAHPELDEVTGEPVPTPQVPDDALAAHFVGLDPDELPGSFSPAWAGVPGIDWKAGAGFATAAGISSRAGEAMIRDGLVLRHRLPGIWARVVAGQVPVGRARMIAAEVAGAPTDVAAAIDAALAPRADRVGYVALRRLLDEAMVRLYPDEVEAASLEALDRQAVRFWPDEIGHTGLARMEITADYAALHDLDTILSVLADRLAEQQPETCGSTHQVRRAEAVGVIADPHQAQALLDQEEPTKRRPSRRGRRRHATTLVLRITDAALGHGDPVGSVDSAETAPGLVALSEQIAAWCGREATDLTVLPVIDLDAHLETAAYRATAALNRQVVERDAHCLFPWCTRPATGCDVDHVVPHDSEDPDHPDAGGATCSCNTIPLCRRHHRLKTHTAYDPVVIEPGLIWWRTPHGHQFVVDRTGTRAVHRAPPDATGCLRRRPAPREVAVPA